MFVKVATKAKLRRSLVVERDAGEAGGREGGFDLTTL